jgi:hypothetical protein
VRLGQVAGPLTYPLMSRLLSPAFRNIYNCIHTSADGRDNSPVTSVDGIGGSRGLISSTAVDGSKETHAAVRRHAPASVWQTSARWKLHTRPVSHSVVLLSAKQTRATATAFLTCRKPISQQSHDRTKKKTKRRMLHRVIGSIVSVEMVRLDDDRPVHLLFVCNRIGSLE